MSEVNQPKQFAYGPKWIWFGKMNIPYYQNDTEPKLYPDAYIKMVPQEMADRVAGDLFDQLEEAKREIDQLKSIQKQDADKITTLISQVLTLQLAGKKTAEQISKKLQFSREVLDLTLKTMVDNKLISSKLHTVQMEAYDKAMSTVGLV